MSKGEQALYAILREEFPHFSVKKQVTLRYGRLSLYVDFVVDSLKLAFEVDGRQHSQYVPFFHKNRSSFINGKINDGYKQEILDSLHYRLIRFGPKEEITKENLRKKIAALG